MVPGMRHCIGSGGPAPNAFDPLTPLTNSVETGCVVKQMVAAHFQDNNPQLAWLHTMLLCPYPDVAVFQSGDVAKASNWSCGAKVLLRQCASTATKAENQNSGSLVRIALRITVL